MASSSSSSPARREYDVFLSFRGKDTRKRFIGHLYTALDQRGIRTFKDDERLERGRSISWDLLKNINESRIAVIVFSKNYASSSWCLDELVEILECRRTNGQIVLPIFYNVKASEVRKQKRSFAEAFRDHEEIHKEEMEKVQKWRAALKQAASISGLDLKDTANGYEDKFIQRIVQEISKKLQQKPFKVADYEVGIDSRANKLIMLLNDRTEDKFFVGIWGIGGIGKTTLAKAVFNRISNEFERSCFLENVREESTKHGVAKLQQKLLRETLMDNNLKISNSSIGINEIKDRLQHKKILIVLDDVNHEQQIKCLAGIGHNWFGSGSRIIITTRDERLLIKYNVKTYIVELFDENEALELFSWHAFRQNNPVEEYHELSCRIKDYAKGLPLALQVLGSFLCQRSMPEWVSELDKLKTDPNKEIQDVLKISYDGLDTKEKAIFLDIACFFKGCDREFAIDFFESCGFYPVIGIKVLTEKSLVTISEDNKLWMHDLIQEMGQQIVRLESKDPGERSRLWCYEDIHKVFTENSVTKKIEAIMLSEKELSLEGVSFFLGEFHVSADAFTQMRNLRILKVSGVQLLGSPTNLSNELRYLDWNGYPGEYLPPNFHPKKLVRLQLRHSMIKGIWTNTKLLHTLKVLDLSFCENLPQKSPNFSGFPFLEELYLIGCNNLVEVEFDDTKCLDKLKVIDLAECENLKKTPNLSQLPCLESLSFSGCTSLVEIHPSIEFHERLVQLYISVCENLTNLTTNIFLKSLTWLLLDGCPKLDKFPEIQEDMECLEQLRLDGTAIKELSPSIKHLKGLKALYLMNCKMLESLPNNIGEMKSLEELWLHGSGIKDLPPSIVKDLKGLKKLSLSHCERLESLPDNIGEMKSTLEELHLEGIAIKDLPPSLKHLTELKFLDVTDCKMLASLPSNIGELKSLWDLRLGGSSIKKLPSSIAQLTNFERLDWNNCNLDGESVLNLPHSLRVLNLSRNNFASLPTSFTQLTTLEKLDLNGCSSLRVLDSLPSSIHTVDTKGCMLLEHYSIPTNEGSSYDMDFE